MDMERTFKCMFNLKADQDIVALIEAAVGVASLIAPDKLRRHRGGILKSLFSNDTTDHHMHLSDNEEDASSSLSGALSNYSNNVASDVPSPKNNIVGPSPRQKVIKIKLKGFKKEEEKVSHVATLAPPTMSSLGSKKIKDNLMELKLETTKRKLGQLYREEEEKKANRKILCGGRNNNKVKAPNTTARERLFAKMNRRKP